MLRIDKDSKIDVEALKSILLRRGITRRRFSLPYSEEQVKDMLTASVMAEVERRQGRYVRSDSMDSYIARAANWLASPTSKAGLMLCGLTGNGKTTLAKAMVSLVRFCDVRDERSGEALSIRFDDAKDLTRLYRDDYERFKAVRSWRMLAIDDLGCEPAEVLDYGTAATPMSDLLGYRYAEQLPTIVTTNINARTIREKYGERLADRFNEMMEVIIFENGSYRGRNI